MAVQYAQNDQLAPLQVRHEVLLLQCGQHVLQSKIIPTAHAQEVAVQYAQNDQLAPLLVRHEVLLL